MSKYSGDGDIADVLRDIKDVAVEHNRKKMITGVLFFRDGHFLQVIEGEEVDLRDLMAKIELDKRHTDIETLIDTDVEKRGFSNWHMDSFHLGAGHTFDVEVMKQLTASFEKNLLPRSDTLIYFYKALLSQSTHKAQAV